MKKIKRSDLEKLSNAEIAALVQKAQELEQAQKSKSLDRYMETAHDDQHDFHSALARIRFFMGGNRCLRDSSLIETASGPQAIADIDSFFEVLSWDESLGQFRFARASAPFPKGKDYLYRVVHEQGEFVASAEHLVFCSDHAYRPVRGLIKSGASLLAYSRTQPGSIVEPSPKSLLLDARCLKKTPLDYLGDYGVYTHPDDQPPLWEEEFYQVLSQLQAGVLALSRLADLSGNTSRADAQAELIRVYNHLDLNGVRLVSGDSEFHDQARSCFESLDRILSVSFGRISFDIRQAQQSLRSCVSHLRALLFVRSTPDVGKLDPLAFVTSPITSKIKTVERLPQKEWYWDLVVPGTNNYLAEGAIHHNSGKTTSGAVESLWCLLGRHPFRKLRLPLKGAVVVQDFENHAKNILEPKILQWAPTNVITGQERNQNGAWRKLNFVGGSTLDVLSHDQDIKVFEGGDYDFVWFDEPPPKKIFTALWRGLTDRGGFTFITATPLTTPWLYGEIKKAEEGDSLRWFRYVDTEKNAFNIGEGDKELGLKRIREFSELLDPEEREARLHGKFVHMMGLIFKAWKRSHHLIPEFAWPAHWPIVESIDPHPHKPYGISWIGIAENGCKILLRSGLYQGVIEEIGEQVLYERTQIRITGNNKPRIVRCLIDNYASVALWQRSQTEPTARRLSVREELENIIGPRGGGPRIEVAPKNVKGKIDIFKQWLHVGAKDKSTFYVFDNHENERFIFEIENYIWDSKRGGVYQGLKDQPLKKDDDILDSILQVALTYKNDLLEVGQPIKAGASRSWKV